MLYTQICPIMGMLGSQMSFIISFIALQTDRWTEKVYFRGSVFINKYTEKCKNISLELNYLARVLGQQQMRRQSVKKSMDEQGYYFQRFPPNVQLNTDKPHPFLFLK